jgi:circadian clock protein KaiB
MAENEDDSSTLSRVKKNERRPKATELHESDSRSKADVIREFRLYVAGNAPNSALALENFHQIGRDFLAGRYDLDIVDVLDDPLRALEDGVLVTPTLIRLSPPPLKIVGNLSDTETVLIALGLKGKKDG